MTDDAAGRAAHEPGLPPAPTKSHPTVLSRLQRGIELLYRVNTGVDVEAFLVDDDVRRQAGVTRAPREQLLISQRRSRDVPHGDRVGGDHGDGDEVRIGLFIDRDVVSNLEKNDPGRGLDDSNFGDFCLAVEGVSHFVYVALCAANDRPVSALELELQAEVDKFACCFLVADGALGDPEAPAARGAEGAHPDGRGTGVAARRGTRQLTARLYEDVSFASDLDGDERDRYRVANLEARRYTESLSRTFVARDRVYDMFPELRRFYRLGLGGKLGHIARLAA